MQETIPPDIETASDDYARRFSQEVGRYFLDYQEWIVRELLRAFPPGKVLDVGGGHGQLTQALLDLSQHVTVHGSASECHARVRSLFLPKYDEKLTLAVSPLTQLPFEDRQFDTVLAFRLLAHVEDWQGFTAELARVARTALIFDYASLASLNVLAPVLFKIKKKLEGNTRTYFCHTLRQVTPVLEQLGFEMTEVRKQFVAPMGLHRALNNRRTSERLEAGFKSLGLTPLFGSPAIVLAKRCI